MTIRLELPTHLRILARIDGEVTLDVDGEVTQRSVLDALEEKYPMLRGTIRDQVTHQRRAFLRFFACGDFGWERSVPGFVGEVFGAGEEAQKRAALLGIVVADGAAEHGIARL